MAQLLAPVHKPARLKGPSRLASPLFLFFTASHQNILHPDLKKHNIIYINRDSSQNLSQSRLREDFLLPIRRGGLIFFAD